MPWSIVIRWVVRIATTLIFWRLASGRRPAFAHGAPGATGAAGMPRHFNPDSAAALIRQSATLVWRVVSAAILTVAAVLLLVGGVTIVVLTPRWLGALFLAAALAAGAAAWFESHLLVEAMRRRARGQHDDTLRRIAD